MRAGSGPICELAVDVLSAFTVLMRCIDWPDELSKEVKRQRMADELGRYRIWANNIGALRRGAMSLDGRLAEAAPIAIHVQRVLKDLIISINLIKEIVYEERQQEHFDALSDFEDTSGDEEMISLDQHDRTHNNPPTEIEALCEAVVNAITTLFKYSVAIRKASIQDPYAKLHKRLGVAQIEATFDKNHITDMWRKFRGNPVVNRLSEAMVRRRQFFFYRSKHHERLAGPIEQTEAQSSVGDGSIYSKATTLAANAAVAILIGKDIDSDAGESTTSTTYDTLYGEDAETLLRVPPLPTEAQYGSHFQCPYCFTIVKVANRPSWKRHVFQDLRPYVCTLPECELELFRSRHEWFEHELQEHRQMRECSLCSTTLKSKSLFMQHLHTAHLDTLTGDQIQAAFESSKVIDARLSTADCPFCDDWTTSFEARLAQLEISAPRMDHYMAHSRGVTNRQFRDHVGKHLEQLALFALPKHEAIDESDEIDGEDEDSSTADKHDLHDEGTDYENIADSVSNADRTLGMAEVQSYIARVNGDTMGMAEVQSYIARVNGDTMGMAEVQSYTARVNGDMIGIGTGHPFFQYPTGDVQRQDLARSQADSPPLLPMMLPMVTSGNEGSEQAQKNPSHFTCTLCDRRFRRSYALQSHLRRMHANGRPFVCYGFLKENAGTWGCNRAFVQADALARHLRSKAGNECIRPLLDEEATENIINDSSLATTATTAPLDGSPRPLPAALLHMYPALAADTQSPVQLKDEGEYDGSNDSDVSS